MARAALKWSINDLRDAAGVGRMSVARFEAGDNIADDTKAKLEKALLDAGAQFSKRSGRVSVSVPE